MPETADYLANNPLLDTFVTDHGAVIKSPASFARALIKAYALKHWALDVDPDVTPDDTSFQIAARRNWCAVLPPMRCDAPGSGRLPVGPNSFGKRPAHPPDFIVGNIVFPAQTGPPI
ncbi:hypothetical protein [Pseudomonas maioricensis]|uniref:hypothetical protein n=1 Tax=Pseudomonas maioricensis TaxID=1766623 RepID=UPI001FAD3A85|nr:hypothetical protein [Pseudomonas sp. S25]